MSLPAGFLSFVPTVPAPPCSYPSGDLVRCQNISPLAQAGDLCPCSHPSLRVPSKVGTGGLLGQPRQLAPHAHLEGRESREWYPSKHLKTRPRGVLTVHPHCQTSDGFKCENASHLSMVSTLQAFLSAKSSLFKKKYDILNSANVHLLNIAILRHLKLCNFSKMKCL